MAEVVATTGCGGPRRVYVFADSYEEALEAAQAHIREHVLVDTQLQYLGDAPATCEPVNPGTGREDRVYKWDIVPVRASIGRTCPVQYDDV